MTAKKTENKVIKVTIEIDCHLYDDDYSSTFESLKEEIDNINSFASVRSVMVQGIPKEFKFYGA